MDPPDSVIPVELSNIAEIVEVVSIVPVTEEEVRAFNDLAWETVTLPLLTLMGMALSPESIFPKAVIIAVAVPVIELKLEAAIVPLALRALISLTSAAATAPLAPFIVMVKLLFEK